MRKLGVVILTWNSEKYISACLNSILEISGYEIEIKVVDNGSTDNTKTIIKKFHSSIVQLIELEKNLGTTISRNIGINALSDVDYLCILDSDTVVNQTAIDGLIGILDHDDKVGIVGPKMMNSKGIVQNSGRRIPTITEKILKVVPIKLLQNKANILERYDNITSIHKVGYLMSACWMLRGDMTTNIGLLDEKIFYAPEDVEFCMRAWVNGFKVMYAPEYEIVHEWQRLSRKKLISKHNIQHIAGLLYLYRKYKFLFNTHIYDDLIERA